MNPNQAFQFLFGVNSISDHEYRIQQLSEHLARDMGMTRNQLFKKMSVVNHWSNLFYDWLLSKR